MKELPGGRVIGVPRGGSIPPTPQDSNKGDEMSRDSLEGAIANSLWRHYDLSLPDTPWRMAVIIAHQIRKEGYAKEKE